MANSSRFQPFNVHVLVCSIIKILILACTVVVVVLMNPVYANHMQQSFAYILMYVFQGLTLLYCIVSIVSHCITAARFAGASNTFDMTESILVSVCIMMWLYVCGMAWSISDWTIWDTGENYAIIAGLSVINIFLFLSILAIYVLDIVKNKVLSQERKTKYSTLNSRASLPYRTGHM